MGKRRGLVFISSCRLTVKQHYQPKTKAARALIIFLRRACERQLLCFQLRPLLLLLLFLSSLCFTCLSAHTKTDVKCTCYTFCLRQIRASCIQTRGFHIREILQTSARPACSHHFYPCVTVKGCGEERSRGEHPLKSNSARVCSAAKRPERWGSAAGAHTTL